MKPSDLFRLFRTVRYLRREQIIGRVMFKLHKPHPDLSPPPALRVPSGPWVDGARRRPSLSGATEFNVLGNRWDIGEHGWDSQHIPKLTRYNLHYFDDLNAAGAESRRAWHHALLSRWIVENPPAEGSGWEPYPLSLRIVNWIKWAQTIKFGLTPEMIESLATQVRYLSRRLEWHILGNHLFVNAKALVFAGLFFEGVEADDWLRTGLSILDRQLREQILADGGQFELSPMYHALAVEDLLDLINIARRYEAFLPPDALAQAGNWAAHLPRMLSWLQTMSHPDGRIAFFNDAAFGIAPENSELYDYARNLDINRPLSLDEGLHLLPESGYCRLAQGQAVAIVDVAEVGPSYLPGHAHADTLSFEWSLGNQRIVVNGGTSVYGTDAQRQQQRGTAAHSTLAIDAHNSSEVWSGFRVGRRAQVSNIYSDASGKALVVGATHNGYSHLPGRPLHRRDWKLDHNKLIITDRVDGRGRHTAEINFHLHPDVQAAPGQGHEIDIVHKNGEKLATVIASCIDGIEIAKSSWHPEFGMSIESQCLRISLAGEAPLSNQTTFKWSGF